MKAAALVSVLALVALSIPALGQVPTTPYDTKVKADDVNTRSGPGDYWYVTGKLHKGQTVKVLGHQFGWAEIVPPADHSSLVRIADVDARGNVGTVKGDRPVAVRACAFGEKRVNRIQMYLAPAAQVTILRVIGTAYYQIASPQGATVFVDARMLAEPGTTVTDVRPPRPDVTTRPEATTLPDNITVMPRPTTWPDTIGAVPPTFDLRSRMIEDVKLINAQVSK
ncbi:MAG: hypothetical protein PHU85_12710, partial [Phycisphaerae bacterium]|nr:hypothetical protein [Phycisphaerae bacterium]